MKPVVSQVCSLSSPFENDLEQYAAAGCQSIEVWLTKLETYLDRHSLADVQQQVAQQQVELPVASLQGGILASQGDARAEAWHLFSRRLDLCRDLQIQTLVVACDVAAPINEETVRRVEVSLKQAAEQASERGVRLALEFKSDSSFGNNLQTAAVLVEQCGQSNLGICLDACHFYVGPSKMADLQYLSKDNLFHVQLSDLADVPRELAGDADRIMPGDGDIPLAEIVNYLRNIGYDGTVSVELMNPLLWQTPAQSFAEVALSALQRLIGTADER